MEQDRDGISGVELLEPRSVKIQTPTPHHWAVRMMMMAQRLTRHCGKWVQLIMKSIIWLGVLIFLSSPEEIVCQPQSLEVSVNELVSAGMTARGIPGVSLAVVHNGNVVLTKGYGFQNVITKNPADADTVFGLASLTKAFTTAALAKMLRKNSTYTRSTTIKTILGESTTKFNNTLLSTYATLQDLMTHAMGIPRNNFIRLDKELTRDNLMARLQYLPSTKEFRRSFIYSDLMYGLLTHIIEVLGGRDKQWEDIVTSELFQPLGMANSTFMTRVNFSASNIATPYSVDKDKQVTTMDAEFLRLYSSIGGSGAIMSTAKDMAKYLQFLVNGGKNQEGQQVVEASDLKAAFTPLAALSSSPYPIRKPITPVTMSTDAYGLGWRIGYYRGYKMIQHTGSTFGYKSMITILPDSGSAVYTALNGDDDGYSFRVSLHCAILDLLLHENPWINTTTIATFPYPWVRTARRKRDALRVINDKSIDGYTAQRGGEEEGDTWLSRKSIDGVSRLNNKRCKRDAAVALETPLTNFTGYYFHGAYGGANIVLDSASDKLRLVYGIGVWELTHTGSGLEFNADWLGPAPSYEIQLKFLANENVYGFECLDCDPNYVPAFYRH